MIEFVNVTKAYSNKAALDDVSFEIDKGEFVFLVGPSGSGKTTIIKMLIKDEDPSAGQIFFYETDINQIKGAKVTQLRREIGVVFQDFKLLPQKNLFENIAFALEVSGKNVEDIEKTVSYVLDLVGLADRAEAFPDEISGGEKQKIAIARAIANNPKVLIADEPTGNLDPESSWDIINLLLKINEWGTTVIMATHGNEIVDKLEKRVMQLDKGKIISDTRTGTYPTIKPKKKKMSKSKDAESEEGEFEIDMSKIQPLQTPDPKILKDENAESSKEEENVEEKEKSKKKDTERQPHAKGSSSSGEKTGLPLAEKAGGVKRKKKPRQPLAEEPNVTKNNEVEEKEFEITFTTKRKVPLTDLTSEKPKKTKSKKKPEKKTPTLKKLHLSPKIEGALKNAGISTIAGLKKMSKRQLKKIRGIGTKDAASIKEKLEK